jgi:gamma-glutamyltranspeptidase
MSEHRSHRPAVMGMRGMAATAHPLASAARLENFWRGGNAVDAAAAAAATLNLVEPFKPGIGGDSSPFGSGFLASDTGILLNNLLMWNDRDPKSPHVLVPHR